MFVLESLDKKITQNSRTLRLCCNTCPFQLPFPPDGLKFLELGVSNTTVLFPINGHSKKQTPLVSEWFYLPQRNSGQTLIENFLKKVEVIGGHSA